MKLKIKVLPGSSRDSFKGWLDDTLKISVKAAPEKGKANKAVAEVLATVLGVPMSNIRILQGHTSSRKIVEIDGLNESEIYQKLGEQK